MSRNRSEFTEIRMRQSKLAIVFLHGFGGDMNDTWDSFPLLLAAEDSLRNWDIVSLGYSTNLLPGTRAVWSASPDLPTLSIKFFTKFDIPPLLRCHRVAMVAHSMGGLIAQRMVLDYPELKSRVKHLFLFGTPSAGIRRANFLQGLFGRPMISEQVNNMATDSPFITKLRANWREQFGENPPFQFYAIAGDRDQFVGPETSLGPFPMKYRRVVPGDHVSMVKPRDGKEDAVRLIVSGLTRTDEPEGPKSELRMASELGEKAPEGMAIARAAAAGQRELKTQAEIVEAALALDRVGQQKDAITLLERYQHMGTDVQGTLAGRIKRRWVQEGQEGDAHWALGLYESALRASLTATEETQDTIGQAFYHAINVAYLKYVAFGELSQARATAGIALGYAQRAVPTDMWSVATEAEAWLYLGDEEKALQKYAEVIAMSPERWKLISTGQQAQQIAAKMKNDSLQQRLKDLFESRPIGRLATAP